MKGGPFIVRWLLRLGKPKIKRPGVDVAGEMEAVGRNVNQFKRGNEIFGTCRGAIAEYALSGSALGLKSVLVMKPKNVDVRASGFRAGGGINSLARSSRQGTNSVWTKRPN